MVRVVIFVIAIVGIFGGTLVYGGERLGAWDQAEPQPPSGLQPIIRPEEKKDKDGAGVAAEKITPAEARWIRETNALCRRARAETSGYDQPESLGEFEKLLLELQAKNKEYNDAFAAIPPAKSDRRSVAAFLALLDRDERLVAELLAALREGNAAALVRLTERLALVAQEESEILLSLGASDCDVALLAPTY